MDGTGVHAAAFVLAGAVSGMFSGALGIGGAAVATPLVRLLGVSPYLAVGTPVPMILPSTITGAITYLRAGLVDRRAVIWTAPLAAVAAFGGAMTTRLIGETQLMLICAAVLFVLALRVLPDKDAPLEIPEPPQAPTAPIKAPAAPQEKPAASQEAPAAPQEKPAAPQKSRIAYLSLGVGTGFASGLLGVGGGFLMVPVFIRHFGMPTKVALGTSLAVIALTVPPNIIGHTLAHNIDWPAALLLSLGVVPGARLGAKMAIRAPERKLRIVMAVTLTIVSLTYAGGELVRIFGE